MARSRDTSPSPLRPGSLPGIRTRRQLPRLPVPRRPRISVRRSCAERLGPGPDGPDRLLELALATGLEVRGGDPAERLRAHVGDASLDRPADSGDERHGLAGDGSETEPGADHREDLER